MLAANNIVCQLVQHLVHYLVRYVGAQAQLLLSAGLELGLEALHLRIDGILYALPLAEVSVRLDQCVLNRFEILCPAHLDVDQVGHLLVFLENVETVQNALGLFRVQLDLFVSENLEEVVHQYLKLLLKHLVECLLVAHWVF